MVHMSQGRRGYEKYHVNRVLGIDRRVVEDERWRRHFGDSHGANGGSC